MRTLRESLWRTSYHYTCMCRVSTVRKCVRDLIVRRSRSFYEKPHRAPTICEEGREYVGLSLVRHAGHIIFADTRIRQAPGRLPAARRGGLSLLSHESTFSAATRRKKEERNKNLFERLARARFATGRRSLNASGFRTRARHRAFTTIFVL